MSKDTDRVLGHADEADGIEEYDNPLPDWWLGLLWLTVIWAVGYTVHYHFIGDRSQEGAFRAEVVAAAERWPAGSAGEVAIDMSAAAAEAGEAVYTTYCVMCHGPSLEGGIGASLVDDEWVHGSEPENIIATITNGVPEMGMVAWGPVLTPKQINDVAAYVRSRSFP